MPIYDYVCRDCGQSVEVIHAVDGVRPATCAHCGGSMRRVMSAPAIVFKGSGWAKKERAGSAGRATDKTVGDGATADSTDTGGSAEASSTVKSVPKPAP